MSIIRTLADAEATGEVARRYAEDREEWGFVPAHTRAMAMNTDAIDAFERLIGSVRPTLGFRRYELVTLAAARGTRSRHCRLAHGAKSLELFGAAQLERIARDYSDAGLPADEVAMMRYAEQVGRDPSSMTDADAQRLRDAGFSDREIVDITIAASARSYFAGVLQALSVDVDAPPSLSEPLRQALLEGI